MTGPGLVAPATVKLPLQVEELPSLSVAVMT